MKILLKICFLTLGLIMVHSYASAQCAMCRATIENNISSGDTTIGAGLNTGILYLLIMPYLIAGLIGFLWYRNAKKRKEKFIFQRDKF